MKSEEDKYKEERYFLNDKGETRINGKLYKFPMVDSYLMSKKNEKSNKK